MSKPTTAQPRPKDLRDEFAMVAMRMAYSTDSLIQATTQTALKNGLEATELVARVAYKYADAMMKEREAQP